MSDRFAMRERGHVPPVRARAPRSSRGSTNGRSRHSRAQLEWLVELSTDLERSHRAEDVHGEARPARRAVGSASPAPPCSCSAATAGGACSTTASSSRCWRPRSEPRIARRWTAWRARRRCSCGRSTTACSTRCCPTRATSSSHRSSPTTKHFGDRGRPSGAAGTTRRSRVLTVQALAQAGDAHRRRRCATRRCSTRSSGSRHATRSPGIANRRLFDESLEREAARSQRLDTPLSLLVLDVDHFKQINDTYGHLAGDAVLREVADSIVEQHQELRRRGALRRRRVRRCCFPAATATTPCGVAERVRAEIARQVRTCRSP